MGSHGRGFSCGRALVIITTRSRTIPPFGAQVGPRLDLEIVKIEEGLCNGKVLYHAHVEKTPEEAAALQNKTEERERLRRQRRAEQVGRCNGSVLLGVFWRWHCVGPSVERGHRAY